MTNQKILRSYRIYGIILSIAVIFVGICFMASCLNIYYSGDQPYTREAVAKEFADFDILVYGTVILAVIGLAADLIYPIEKRDKPTGSYANILKNLRSKKDISRADNATLVSINNERKNRKIHSIIRTVLLCLSCIVFLSYALNINNFHQSEINGSMIKAMWVLIPCLLVPFVYAVFTVYHNESSFKRELELLKQLPSKESADTTVSADDKFVILRIIILTVAVAALLYGFFSGGTADVLTKAINICTECIGLG